MNLQKDRRGASTAGGQEIAHRGEGGGQPSAGRAGPPSAQVAGQRPEGGVEGRPLQEGSGETHKGVLGPLEGLQLLWGQRLELGHVAAPCTWEGPEGRGHRSCSCPARRRGHQHQHQRAARGHVCVKEGQKDEGREGVRG